MRLVYTGAAILAAAVLATYALSGPCGWLERTFGAGACLERLRIRNLVVTGDTIAADSSGQLVLAGVHYRLGRGNRNNLQAQLVIVKPIMTSRVEEERLDLGMVGIPDQMRLSPQGDRFAISCNALYVCDLPGGNDHEQSRMMVFDRDGERLWFGGIPHDNAPPNAAGRTFDLAWSASGGVLFAHLAFAAADGGVILTRQLPLGGTTGEIPSNADAVPESNVTLPDLPSEFISFGRQQTALSPDGGRIAILTRRFSGPGEVRAILQVFDLTSGQRVIRHEIFEDLAPALLWHPSRDAVIVAVNDEAVVDAGTELRFYRTGEAVR